ncbi:MAG TPA: hypothetical protein DC042_04830 [Bacteroidales bacterium]|nr:hypothetical protein [Bacteroidales bacterium]
MEPIELDSNHKRVLSGTIYLIEKLVNELEQELFSPPETIMVKKTGIPDTESQDRCLAVIGEVKAMIGNFSVKYGLEQEQFELQQLINAKKAVMWEMLHETESRHLAKYGVFPAEIVGEFDADIRKLLKLVEKL